MAIPWVCIRTTCQEASFGPLAPPYTPRDLQFLFSAPFDSPTCDLFFELSCVARIVYDVNKRGLSMACHVGWQQLASLSQWVHVQRRSHLPACFLACSVRGIGYRKNCNFTSMGCCCLSCRSRLVFGYSLRLTFDGEYE